MTNQKYILEGKEIIPVDFMAWAKWLETADRHVANDTFGEVRVSTVFLGLDHNFGDGEPLLFETMIFGGKHDGYQERYATWDEAYQGHRKALDLIGEKKK